MRFNGQLWRQRDETGYWARVDRYGRLDHEREYVWFVNRGLNPTARLYAIPEPIPIVDWQPILWLWTTWTPYRDGLGAWVWGVGVQPIFWVWVGMVMPGLTTPTPKLRQACLA